MAVVTGGMIILIALIYHLGISPIQEKRTLLNRQLSARFDTLTQLSRLTNEYDQRQQQNSQAQSLYAQRENRFTLFAFLEQLAVKSNVDKHIDYMRPSTSTDKDTGQTFSLVEMKLKGIKLSQLVSYLYHVETSPNVVTIKRLSISRDGKTQNTISAVMHVETQNT